MTETQLTLDDAMRCRYCCGSVDTVTEVYCDVLCEALATPWEPTDAEWHEMGFRPESA